MKLRTRIAAVAAASALLVGVGATSASAAQRYTASVFPNKASCHASEQIIQWTYVRNGYEILAGDGCYWNASKKKWAFSFLYE